MRRSPQGFVPSVHCSGVLMRPEVKQIADNLGVIPQAMAERKQWLLALEQSQPIEA